MDDCALYSMVYLHKVIGVNQLSRYGGISSARPLVGIEILRTRVLFETIFAAR